MERSDPKLNPHNIENWIPVILFYFANTEIWKYVFALDFVFYIYDTKMPFSLRVLGEHIERRDVHVKQNHLKCTLKTGTFAPGRQNATLTCIVLLHVSC